MEKFFTNENLVIITSKDEVDAFQWKKYLETNWERLIRKNAKILVLAGIHGEKDGQLGNLDHNLFEDYQRQIKYFMGKSRKKPPAKISQDILDKNVQFVLEDVGKSFNTTELDKSKLIQAVEKHNPTIISLSFCYTNVSQLNEVFRSAGIYTVLIMSQDQAEITEDRYVILDPVQKQIIQQSALQMPKNVFLWGSTGTGKTLILTQLLAMKISEYTKRGLKLKVFVSSYMSGMKDSMLMNEFKNRYLKHLTSLNDMVQFIPFEQLCKGK